MALTIRLFVIMVVLLMSMMMMVMHNFTMAVKTNLLKLLIRFYRYKKDFPRF